MRLNCEPSLLKFLSHLAKCGPHKLKKEEPRIEFTILSVWLGKDLASELLTTLNETRRELVPEHAEDNELMNAFWEQLVCEVDGNPQHFNESPLALNELVENFGKAWKNPLSEFEIIYSIENLSLGTKPIAIMGVEFFDPTEEVLEERGIEGRKVGWLNRDKSTFALAAVKVAAAPSTGLFQAGKRQVVGALTVMRVAAMRGRASQSTLDELFQWKLSGFCLARSTSAGDSRYWQEVFYRQFHPLVMDLSSPIQEGLRELKLECLEDLPVDIRNRILRSLYWITHSVNHESDDHKLVDLFTAMEILLIPEGRAQFSKGNIIALRYQLLLGNIIDTSVKWLYDCRNDVVHGEPLPVVSPHDVWQLRLACYTTIRSIVHFANTNPDVSLYLELIGRIESEKRLTNFIHISSLSSIDDDLLPKIVDVAVKRLKKVRSSKRK